MSELTRFQRLTNARDLAAYRAVAVLGVVIDFWEAEDFDSALAQLKRARAEFLEADARVTEFHNQRHQQKESTNGHRTIA
jgi:hypothetical protein